MIRVHQFDKVELVSIVAPEHAAAEHERMTRCAEAVLERLGLPWRRMLLSAGDMGFAARKDLGPGSVAARPERLARDFQLFGLRRLPGPAHERALPAPPAAAALRASSTR